MIFNLFISLTLIWFFYKDEIILAGYCGGTFLFCKMFHCRLWWPFLTYSEALLRYKVKYVVIISKKFENRESQIIYQKNDFIWTISESIVTNSTLKNILCNFTENLLIVLENCFNNILRVFSIIKKYVLLLKPHIYKF